MEALVRTLVLGVAGTGKSYLVKEMKSRGMNAIDADDGLATFVDRNGNEVEYNSREGAEWWSSHYYVLKLTKLKRLLGANKSIYVFGDVGGQPGKRNGLLDVIHLFDRVCYMRAPTSLIRKRLAERRDNPFGKNPDEVAGTLKHKSRMDEAARRMKFEAIDATMPTDEIIKVLVGSGVKSRV